MLRWVIRLIIVGLLGLGVAYAVSRLIGQDEDFDDFDDIEAGFEFQETPVEIDVPAETGGGLSGAADRMDARGSMSTVSTGASDGPDVAGPDEGSQDGEGGGNLTDITGVGPSYAARLEAAGITSIADLAKADAEDIASKMDVIGGSSAVEDWIAQAKGMKG